MIYVEPAAGPAPFVQVIQEVKPGGELMLNFYYLDQPDVLAALQQAASSGVKVYAIVERTPYGISPDKVTAEIQDLRAAGAEVETTPARFQSATSGRAFDHAKYLVTHGVAVISTANLDNAAVTSNREYVYTTQEPHTWQALETLFVADWNGVDRDDAVRNMAPDLVLSPGAEDQIVNEIEQPGPVCVEVEELGDDAPILAALQQKGGNVSLLVPAGERGNDARSAAELAAAGVLVRELPKDVLYLHAKLIVGQAGAYLGSQNFSATSLNANREVGLVDQDQGDLQVLSSTCQQDFAQGDPLPSRN